MRSSKGGWIVLQSMSVGMAISALLLPGRYMFPYYRLQCLREKPVHESCLSFWQILGDIYSIAFLVVPAAAVILTFKRHNLSLPALVIAPVLLSLAGVGAVPLVANVAPLGEARMAAVFVLNAVFMAAAAIIYMNAKQSGSHA